MRLVGTKTDDETLLGIIGSLRFQKHPKIQKFTSATPRLVALVMDVTLEHNCRSTSGDCSSPKIWAATVLLLRTGLLGLLQCYWAAPASASAAGQLGALCVMSEFGRSKVPWDPFASAGIGP